MAPGLRGKVLPILLACTLAAAALGGCAALPAVNRGMVDTPAATGPTVTSAAPTTTTAPVATPTATPTATATATLTAAPTDTPTATASPQTARPATAKPVHTAAAKPATPTPTAVRQPPLLEKMLRKYGHDLGSLPGKLMIMLVKSGGRSRLYVYQKGENGAWAVVNGGGYTACVGKKGLSDNKTEGDLRTPTGLYGIGFAFGNEKKPAIQWEYRPVTKDSYWVDDPESSHYNEWVEGTADRDWRSAEHLSELKTRYAYALVIKYNMDPVVPGRGSAIFLHCGATPTTGCIAIEKANLLKVMKLLRPDSDPRILIAEDD